MAQGDINVTIVGNLTNDPELRFTPSGAAVASFTIASNSRYLDKTTNEWKDGEPVYMRCSVWRQYAENVAESLTRGTRVIATGRLKQRSYETREGEKRTVVEMEVDDVGPALRTATAKVTKVARSGGGFGDGGASQGGGFGGGAPQGGDDPWASQGGGGGNASGGSWGGGGASYDEPPF
ncbi:MAG: single-stranded DNA-binding protein [Candidatus Nanopelagicales bacterium]